MVTKGLKEIQYLHPNSTSVYIFQGTEEEWEEFSRGRDLEVIVMQTL